MIKIMETLTRKMLFVYVKRNTLEEHNILEIFWQMDMKPHSE